MGDEVGGAHRPHLRKRPVPDLGASEFQRRAVSRTAFSQSLLFSPNLHSPPSFLGPVFFRPRLCAPMFFIRCITDN